MRRQKYFFDFKFGISVKFRVDWCIRLNDSYLICQYSLYFVHIHAYANMNSRENVGKFEVNHIVLYINRREILRWFRIWSQKNIFACAFSRKSRFKNLVTNIPLHYAFTLEYFSSNYFFEIISYQNYIICRIAIFGMIYFQRTVAKWYFAEWHISKHFFAESRLRNIWLPNNLFPIFQFPNISCRIVLPNGSVAECLFCRMVFCRMWFLRNIVAEWPTLLYF